MIPNRWTVLLFFLLSEIVSSTYRSHADKALNSSRSHDQTKFHVQKKNSQALNNFLEDVLMAKDELKWIDQMIYPQARRHKSHETRRRLLSKGRVASRKKKHRNGNKNSIERTNSAGQRKEALKKIKKDVIVKKSMPAAKRHYFTPDVHGFGVIEYYDYDESPNKRKISNKKAGKHSSIIVKKKATKNPVLKKKKFKDKNRKYKIPQELVSNQENLHSAKLKHARNTLEKKQKRQNNDIEEIEAVDGLENGSKSIAKVNGREARCHRDRDDDAVDDFKSQRDFNYQKNTRMSDGDYHSAQNIYDDFDPFFLEVGNTSSSGSDYQALKATDDLFKGGMEQGNSNDNNIPPADDYSQKKIFNHWKTVKIDSRFKIKKNPLIESRPDSQYMSDRNRKEEIDQKPISNSALSSSRNVKKNKESKNKRSNIISGPILRHESIVEPLNWPWEYYDDKDELKIRFGRGLMQVSEENNDDQNSFLFNSQENEVKRSENRFDKILSEENKHTNEENRSKRDEQTPNDDFLANFTVNGKLTDDIVNKIFDEVEASNTLNTGLRPGLSRKTNLEDHVPAKCPPEEYEQEVNRTSTILKQVGKLLNHLVAQRMQKKMCLRLTPHQRDFLIWITDNTSNKYARHNPQHSILHEKPSENLERLLNQEKSRYLFGHLQKPIKHSEVNAQLESSGKDSLDDELKLKTQLLKRLIKQYESLSASEQIKVEDIHKYLRRQLNLLQKYEKHRILKKHFKTPMSKKRHHFDKKYLNSFSDFPVNKKGPSMSSSINKVKYRRDLRKEQKVQKKKSTPLDNEGGKSLEQFNSSVSLISLSNDFSEDGNQKEELQHSSSSTCRPRSKYDRWIEVFENRTTNNILSPSNQSSVKSIEIFSTISSTSSPLAAFTHNSVSDENGSFVTEKQTCSSDAVVNSADLISQNTHEKDSTMIYTYNRNEREENLGEQLRNAKDLESRINVFPVNNNNVGEE